MPAAPLVIKLAYGFAGLAGVATVGAVTGVIPVADWIERMRVEQPAPEPDTMPAPLVNLPEEPEPETETALVVPEAPASEGEPAPTEVAPASDPIVPAFDVLRVEPDGSVVIAGTAAPGARVEAFSGSRSLGETQAAANGDFVIIFDEPLEPGDYEIVLRADAPDGTTATSTETAIVSVPERGDDGVLALVEQPGEPSRLIASGEGAAEPLVPVEPADPPEPEVATETPEPEPIPLPVPDVPAVADLRIEAVEIDGDTTFVAGAARAGSRLNIYANEILLGTTTASEAGRFLVEARRNLAVGDYLIRADVLADNGADVILRAAVPFVRQPGERLAAIALDPAVQLPPGGPQLPDGTTPLTAPSGLDPLTAEVPFPQQALQPVDTSVIIRRGDTLWQISRRVYGRGIKYTTIYRANTDQIRDPDWIWPGQVFAVPAEADPDPENDPS